MIHIIRFFSMTALLFVFTAQAQAQETGSLTKDDVTAIIQEFIRDNPTVIIDSLKKYEADQRIKEEEEAAARLSDHEDYLLNGDLPRVGNPDADVQIVEFYDYNCGYCRHAFKDLQILLQDDKNVQITLVEMPILGEQSVEAAKWSTAAADQEKFFNFHGALMGFSGPKTPENLTTLAENSGIDMGPLLERLEDPAILDQFDKNRNVAYDIGIRGTPGFIVNGEIIAGYPRYDGLVALIKEARAKIAEEEKAANEESPESE